MTDSSILRKPKTRTDRVLALIIFFVFAWFSRAQENVVNIQDYGAKGDGKTLNTQQIQQAIDYCNKQGGGKVVVPVGVYLTGTLSLKSNIELFLAPGAELIGSPELKDYPKTEHTSEHRNTFLIYASNANKVSITGQGTINGNDTAFMDWDAVHPGCCVDAKYTRQGESFGNAFPDGPSAIYGNPENRPGVLISLMNCSDVSIRDITIKNAPNWCLHLAGCQGADLRNLKVLNSLLVPNADGIDVSNSKNVTIEDCTIIAGDDGIAISPCGDGYATGAAENIQVSHCNITSRSAGIRLGYSENDIRNCSFKDLYIQSNRGICINTRHDEIIEDITFEDIILDTRLHTGWWGNGEPIHISEIPLGTLHGISSDGKDNGLIKNIRFKNIDITGESGMVFYGHSPNSIQGIALEQIRFKFKSSPLNSKYGGNFDLRPAFDDKYGVFKAEIPAIFMKNVQNVSVRDFELTSTDELMDFHTQAIHAESFGTIRIAGFKGASLRKEDSNPVFRFKDGKKVYLAQCAIPSNQTLYIKENVAGEIMVD